MSGYIGTQPVPQATQTRQTFVATAAQTSFATAGYSVGYLDVFLNGVKLQDGVDYTATNGSDIVLTIGAALDDTLEVVAYTAFEVLDQTFTGTTTTDGLTVTGAFTSKGIDDNATSTAMTLDSSGNVLVGKTASSFSTAGTQLISGAGGSSITSSGTTALGLNRLASDGDVLTFWKDTSQVGSIAAGAGGFLTIGSPSGTPVYATFANGSLKPTTSLGANNDGGGDLGNVSARWKDAYLSGGVYLGGTGAANKLDDYEEGTWTPTVASGSAAVTRGSYIKIGNQVTLSLTIGAFTDTTSATVITVTNIPFQSRLNDEYQSHGAVMFQYVNAGTNSLTAYINDGFNTLEFFENSSTGAWVAQKHSDILSVLGYLRITISYTAA